MPMILITGLTWLFLLLVPFTRPIPSADVSCSECDHVMDWTQYDGRQPINWTLIDGRKSGIRPGEVVCLKGNIDKRITFRNILGTEEAPVIIRNWQGTVKITSDDAFGLKFVNSKHFKLLGDGSSEPYGIVVTTEKGYFISMESFTSDFEIAHVEIAGPSPNGLGENSGFAGLIVKTSPYEDCELFSDSTRRAWIMRNVFIHDNYIHDTGGEGMYIGHGFYKGREESRCVHQGMLYSHSIKNLKIYHNLLENIGYDGIQIKNADSAVTVYGNIVRNYGTRQHNAHNEGLFIGEGTTGQFHNNIIDTGTGNGCKIQAIGNLDFHDNLILNSGKNGIYATDGPYAVRLDTGYFHVDHNAIYNSGNYGFLFYGDAGGPKQISDNLVVNAQEMTKKGAQSERLGNFFSNNVIDRYEPAGYPLHINSTGIQNHTALQRCQEYLQRKDDQAMLLGNE